MREFIPKINKINFISRFGKTNFKVLVIVIILVIIGFIIWPTGVFKPVKNIVYQALKPFSISSNVIFDRFTIFFEKLILLGSLGQENQKLIQENLELQSQLAILKEVQHENEILKNEMGFLSRKGDLKLISANIIGRAISGYLKTIVIDRGAKDGVTIRSAVISQGFLVGTVTEIMENSSEVTLITDNNSLVPVVLQDSRGSGLLRGGLKGLTVENIPLNIPIKEGEQVVTSGLGGEIPPGILVGKVEGIVSKEGEIFQKVSVNSPIKIYFLEFVFVVR